MTKNISDIIRGQTKLNSFEIEKEIKIDSTLVDFNSDCGILHCDPWLETVTLRPALNWKNS